MKSKLLLLGFLGLILTNKACQKPTEFNKSAMLKAFVDESIVPNYQDLGTALATFQATAETFQQQPSMTSLENLQTAWKNSMQRWATVEYLTFGPARLNFRHLQLDNTPSSVNAIEQAIADTVIIDSFFISRQSSHTKGLASLEYLLFEPAMGSTVLDLYTTAPNSSRRMAYLLSCIKHVRGLIEELNQAWTTDGYGQTFSQATDNSTNGGIGLISNAVVHMIQLIPQKKLARPLGKELPGNTVHPEHVESPYAQFSWTIIDQNLLGVEEILGDKDKGLGAYLTYITQDEQLIQQIQDKLQSARTKIAARTQSLSADLLSNQTEVEAIYQELSDLYDLMRAVPAYLSITLLPNPDDGD